MTILYLVYILMSSNVYDKINTIMMIMCLYTSFTITVNNVNMINRCSVSRAVIVVIAAVVVVEVGMAVVVVAVIIIVVVVGVVVVAILLWY